MISATSVTDRYALQPSLIEMHKQSLEWLSSTVLWKRELNFFQHLLDDYGNRFVSVEDKKEIDHFQNLILYYQGELIDTFRKKLRDHENHLAKVLQKLDETDKEYLETHNSIIDELATFNSAFIEFKHNIYLFIEKVL
jgi:hypothetical protein